MSYMRKCPRPLAFTSQVSIISHTLTTHTQVSAMARTLCLVALALFAFAAVSAQDVPVTPQRNGNPGACSFNTV